MPKNKRPNQVEQFDVHRTLAHNPGAATASRPPQAQKQPEVLPKKAGWRPKRWIAGLLIFLLLVFIGIIAWDGYNFSNASKAMFGSGNLFGLVNSKSLKGSENGRVNVLVVGYSVDDPGHPGSNLTDSILLLSMDSSNHTGYMLSVPRDLYVSIPGFGYGKINEAYKDGGMPLLEKIISANFQVPVDYYMLVNYGAVRGLVNAVGGISVNIKSPDPGGLFDPNISRADGGPLRLTNGPHSLNGQTALNLTRARGDAYGSYGFPRSDFDRTEHQRQVFSAIKDKATDWKLVFNPLKNRQLFNAVGKNVRTDLQISEVRSLFRLFSSIKTQDMKSISLNSINGRNLLASASGYTNLSALIPAAGLDNYSQIQAAITQLNQ